MSRISRNISIIIRAEKLIARRQVAALGRRLAFVLAAAILGGLGLILLDVAAYLALTERLDPPMAALALALGNLLLAGLFILVANRMSVDRDVREVVEVRDMAIADLEGEVEDATEEVRDLTAGLTRLARDPLGVAGSSLLGPVLGQLLKQIRK